MIYTRALVVSSTDPNTDSAASVQALIDALSVALRRPVLLDDPALHPLAYSEQFGEIDSVRRDSILHRGASQAVRRALLDQGIAEMSGVLRTTPVPELDMDERVCLPVREGDEVLGFLWLLDPRRELGEAELSQIWETARRAAQLLRRAASRPLPDESDLIARLCSPVDSERDGAAAEIRARGLLPDGPLVVCSVASLLRGVHLGASVGGMVARLSPGHVLLGLSPEPPTLILSRSDPVLRVLSDEDVGRWLREPHRHDVAIGQSEVLDGLHGVVSGRHQATVALRVALSRPPEEAQVAWATLGAERLVAQLPAGAAADLPVALVRLLREQPELARTLAAFLDAAGDVKATSEALNLHRSGLYYRLRRIETLSGLALDRGEDRLLAHLAVRLQRLG